MQHFPARFIERAHLFFGEEASSFLKALSEPASLSIRLNPAKLNSQFEHCESVAWCIEGRYLEKRPDFTLDPLFHAGTYYVQEASSMFISYILRQTLDLSQSLRVLDLCAAPGGKSTLLSTLVSNDSLVVANEVISSRVGALTENILKWGNSNVVVSNNDPNDFKRLTEFFDVVVVDAPCSGEGLFRKDQEAIKEWSFNNVQLCEARQKRILDAAQQTVASNGYLIFCTCTFSPEENEKNVKWFVQQYPEFESVKIPIPKDWGIVEKEYGDKPLYSYHFYPHKLKGEGFFVCCLKKTSTINPYSKGEGKRSIMDKNSKSYFLSGKEKVKLKNWIKNVDGYEYYVDEEKEIHAVHPSNAKDILTLLLTLKIKLKGIHIGKLIKEELIPAHHLALSTIIHDHLPFIDFTKEQALQYLSKQNVMLESKLPQGWHLVKYNQQNLGWIKVLSHRINNYYPSDYRIRKAIG